MNDEHVGNIEVVISFDDLLDQVVTAAWWTTNKAYLLDGSYNVLITTGNITDLEDNYPMRSYGTVSRLEPTELSRKTFEGPATGTNRRASSPRHSR